MTGKQHKPAGLSVNTARGGAAASLSPMVDSLLPMKKRSLRTNTLSATTPHDEAADSAANLSNGDHLAVLNGTSKSDYQSMEQSTTTSQKKSSKRAPPKRAPPKKKPPAKRTKKKADLDHSSEMESDNDAPPQSSKKKAGDVFQQYYRNTETWKIVQEKKNVFPHRKGTPSQHIHTMVKNSKQNPSEQIDEKLYSSLKYVLLHKVTPSYFVDENGDMGFILCRVQVVCPDTGEEIRRNGEGILGGSIESSLRMDAVTSMKIQFTSCSSHHDKKHFAFRLQYFLNSNLKEPILVKQSTPFLVYARKKTGTKRKKRSKNAKDDGDDDGMTMDIEEPKPKRLRKNPKKDIMEDEYEEPPQYPDQSASLNALAREMDRIKREIFDLLPASEKSQAKAIVAEKLSISLMTNHVTSAMAAQHSHFTTSSSLIPQTIGTINTPATPSGLFSSNTGTLLTPLQTPNPDHPTNGSGVPQPMSLMHHHDDHHFKHHVSGMEDHEAITSHHHHTHHIQHGTDATDALYAQTPHEHSTDHDIQNFLDQTNYM